MLAYQYNYKWCENSKLLPIWAESANDGNVQFVIEKKNKF